MSEIYDKESCLRHIDRLINKPQYDLEAKSEALRLIKELRGQPWHPGGHIEMIDHIIKVLEGDESE